MPRTTQRLPQPLEPDSLFNFVSSVRDKSVPESPPAPTASAFQLWHVGGPEPAFAQHTLPKVNADGSVMLMYRQCGVEGCIAAEGHRTDIKERNGTRKLREECPLRLTAEELLDHAIRSVAVYHNLCVKNPACVHGYHSRMQNTYLLNGKPKNRLFFNVAVGRWVRELRPVVQSSSEKKHFPRCHLANGSAIEPTTESPWSLAWQSWRKDQQQQWERCPKELSVLISKNSTTATSSPLPSPSPSQVHRQKKQKLSNSPVPLLKPMHSPTAPPPTKKARRQAAANKGKAEAPKPRKQTEADRLGIASDGFRERLANANMTSSRSEGAALAAALAASSNHRGEAPLMSNAEAAAAAADVPDQSATQEANAQEVVTVLVRATHETLRKPHTCLFFRWQRRPGDRQRQIRGRQKHRSPGMRAPAWNPAWRL
jgi:hypothetical protein